MIVLSKSFTTIWTAALMAVYWLVYIIFSLFCISCCHREPCPDHLWHRSAGTSFSHILGFVFCCFIYLCDNSKLYRLSFTYIHSLKCRLIQECTSGLVLNLYPIIFYFTLTSWWMSILHLAGTLQEIKFVFTVKCELVAYTFLPIYSESYKQLINRFARYGRAIWLSLLKLENTVSAWRVV